jgi:membrane protein
VFRRTITSGYEIGLAAYRSWSAHRAIRIGAGVAYYWLFAIVPLTALAFHLAAAFFSVDDIAEWATRAIGLLESVESTEEFKELVAGLLDRTTGSATFGFVGGIAAAISASFAFAATQDAVNMVWDAPKLKGFWENAVRRIVLFVATVAVASLLVVFLLAAAIVGTLESLLPGSLLDKTFAVVSDLAVYLIAFGLIAVAYRYMPWADISWRPPMVSAAVTVVALTLATMGYGWYVDRSNQVSLAGAAGTVLASLVWMYVLAQVFVAGAEVTRALQERWDPDDPVVVPSDEGATELVEQNVARYRPHQPAPESADDPHATEAEGPAGSSE